MTQSSNVLSNHNACKLAARTTSHDPSIPELPHNVDEVLRLHCNTLLHDSVIQRAEQPQRLQNGSSNELSRSLDP